MLQIITAITLGIKIIILIMSIVFTFLGIFAFINWQQIKLLKISNNYSNTKLKPLDVAGLNEELNPFGFAYALNEDIFFSIMYPWQREYGYCKSYDDASPLFSMIIDCEPIRFRYDNRNWLIEFWKGQYGMTTGGEIGFYVSDTIDNNRSFLDDNIIYKSVSDDECIPMFYRLKKKNKDLIIRSNRHWWLTGFKLGEFSKPSQLVMDIEITLKNKTMCDSFIFGLKQVGYKDKDIELLNNTIYLTFKKPHNKQPFTRNILVTPIMQNFNKQNCKFYNSVTKEYKNSLDKINFIRGRFPLLYEKILNFEKTEQLFKSYALTDKNVK